jgi:hypothetical protein
LNFGSGRFAYLASNQAVFTSDPAGVPSRRRFLGLGTLAGAALVAGCSQTAAGPTSTAAQLDLNFDNASLGTSISRHAGARIGRAYGRSGGQGCRLAPTQANHDLAYLIVDQSGFGPGKPYATFSMYFRLVTVPAAKDKYMNLFEIGNTSTAATKSQFTVFFRDNRLTCDFGYQETMDIAAVPAPDTWHSIQAIINFGARTYTAEVRYDDSATKTLTSGDDKTPQSVKVLWVHYPSAPVDYVLDIDKLKMATSMQIPTFLV